MSITDGAGGSSYPLMGAEFASLDVGAPTRLHGGATPSPFQAIPESVDSRSLDLVIDLTGVEPELEVDLRPRINDDASLLVAPGWQMTVKRAVDVVIAILALVVLSPVLLLTALAVKTTSPGPVLFRQKRAGKNGREFDFYKFRTMEVDAETQRDELIDLNEVSRPAFKIRDDPRMTQIGRFLRSTSIDELPQLWNVLRGDMCLVGPRPPMLEEVVEYSNWESQRLWATPGITCIWQVSGRSELDFETWVRMDIEYIQEWCLWLDIKLLLKTIPAVLSRRGAY